MLKKLSNGYYMGSATPASGGGTTINNLDVTVNPSVTEQTLTVPEGYTGYGTITANPVTASIDNNIVAGNIKKDVDILGVTGTLQPSETVTATNLTGLSVTAGDKVYLKTLYANADNGSKIADSLSDYAIMNTLGTYLLDSLYAYTIPVGGQSGVNWSSQWIVNHGVIRCEGTRLFVDEFVITDNIAKTGGYRYAQNGYGMNWSAGLIKLGENYDYSNPVQSWTLTGLDDTNDINDIVVIGNKLYLCKATDSGTKISVYKGTIDANESSVAMTLFDSASCSYPSYSVYNMVKYPAVTTSDNKVGIASNFRIDASKGVLGFKLLTIDNSYDVTGYKTTANNDLASFALNATGTMFNKDAGIFVVTNALYTGIFKYNTETVDFDTMLVLPYSASLGVTISSDGSKIAIDNMVYAITVSDTGYKAVPYESFISTDIITGTASENALPNATFNVLVNAYDKMIDKKKYDITIDSILGDTDANGVLQSPSVTGDLVFTGVKDVAEEGLRSAFIYNQAITGVLFPDLEVLTKPYSMDSAFSTCKNIISINFSKLKTISGYCSLTNAFSGCSNLTSISFPELEEVKNAEAMRSTFTNCSKLTSISFSKLSTLYTSQIMWYAFANCDLTVVEFPMLSSIDSDRGFNGAFQGNKNFTSLSFPALKTTSFGSRVNQFNNMFDSQTGQTSGAFTMHFPSNLESTIQGLTGYPNFGATSGRLTLAFDLPATE